MGKPYEIKKIVERAVLVGAILQNTTQAQILEYLDELAFLADTAGAIVVKRFYQRLDTPHPRTYLGKGKIDEIKTFIKMQSEEEPITMVIFDDELSPSQARNIGNELDCKILDRTNLILDIFASRAKTAHAKVQVELAQLEYLLPRLTGMWTHLERQQGGIGMRGPGETEIETDRRIIRTKIALLKEELKHIDKQKITQRKSRESMVRVALVGYTNVGKSTLMNLLCKSDVFAENKLFATLDTTVRKMVIGNLPFLLTDTVGFIRKLPTHLVESFKSTLDEVRESDVLLHIVDISHPAFEEQIEVVTKTLEEMKAAEKPTFMIFNKIDAFNYTPKDEFDLTPSTKENVSLEELENTWIAKSNAPCLFISAKKKTNLDIFKQTLYDKVKEIHIKRYPGDNFLF